MSSENRHLSIVPDPSIEAQPRPSFREMVNEVAKRLGEQGEAPVPSLEDYDAMHALAVHISSPDYGNSFMGPDGETLTPPLTRRLLHVASFDWRLSPQAEAANSLIIGRLEQASQSSSDTEKVTAVKQLAIAFGDGPTPINESNIDTTIQQWLNFSTKSLDLSEQLKLRDHAIAQASPQPAAVETSSAPEATPETPVQASDIEEMVNTYGEGSYELPTLAKLLEMQGVVARISTEAATDDPQTITYSIDGQALDAGVVENLQELASPGHWIKSGLETKQLRRITRTKGIKKINAEDMEQFYAFVDHRYPDAEPNSRDKDADAFRQFQEYAADSIALSDALRGQRNAHYAAELLLLGDRAAGADTVKVAIGEDELSQESLEAAQAAGINPDAYMLGVTEQESDDSNPETKVGKKAAFVARLDSANAEFKRRRAARQRRP